MMMRVRSPGFTLLELLVALGLLASLIATAAGMLSTMQRLESRVDDRAISAATTERLRTALRADLGASAPDSITIGDGWIEMTTVHEFPPEASAWRRVRWSAERRQINAAEPGLSGLVLVRHAESIEGTGFERIIALGIESFQAESLVSEPSVSQRSSATESSGLRITIETHDEQIEVLWSPES